MKRITLTLGPMATMNIKPDEIDDYWPHWKGGAVVFTTMDVKPFIVEETFDQVTAKILEVA